MILKIPRHANQTDLRANPIEARPVNKIRDEAVRGALHGGVLPIAVPSCAVTATVVVHITG
jgi:hypothetical protein